MYLRLAAPGRGRDTGNPRVTMPHGSAREPRGAPPQQHLHRESPTMLTPNVKLLETPHTC